jgi:hypothetical protein
MTQFHVLMGSFFVILTVRRRPPVYPDKQTSSELADIAAWAFWQKRILVMDDPLLTSLQTDNTFLRMLAYWRYSENGKASRFGCRPVHFVLASKERKPMACKSFQKNRLNSCFLA